MTDRTRNPAEKRKGQLTGETARAEANRLAREERRAANPQPDEPKRRHMAGRRKGRGGGARPKTTARSGAGRR
jgi:hypothetical protein